MKSIVCFMNCAGREYLTAAYILALKVWVSGSNVTQVRLRYAHDLNWFLINKYQLKRRVNKDFKIYEQIG